ncbi:MAG: CopG family transcriptional regulator [Dehalococcoidia bacterium]
MEDRRAGEVPLEYTLLSTLCKIVQQCGRVQILMDDELDDGLERLARKQKRSKSELVREAVRAVVDPL